MGRLLRGADCLAFFPAGAARLVLPAALVLCALLSGALNGHAVPTRAEVNPPSPGDFNLLDVLSKLSSKDNLNALKNFPVPFTILTRSTGTSGPVETITTFKAGSPKRIDVDNNKATGVGGHDIEVLVEQLLGPPFQLRLTITRLTSTPDQAAPDLEAVVAFPLAPFNAETLAAPPYLYWGYTTRDNAAGQTKFIPQVEQLVLTPNVVGGTVHDIGMTLNTTGAPDSVAYLGGFYQNQLALEAPPPGASIVNLSATSLRLTPVPATATLDLNTAELFSPTPNLSSVGLTWSASAPTKAQLTFNEGVGASTAPSAAYTDAITVDQLPTSETLSVGLKLNGPTPSFTIHAVGSATINVVTVNRTQTNGNASQSLTLTNVPQQLDATLTASTLTATFGPASGAQNAPTLGSATLDLFDQGGLLGATPLLDRAQVKLIAVPDFSLQWNAPSAHPTVTAAATNKAKGDFIGFAGVAFAAKDTYPAIWLHNPMTDGATSLDHILAFEDDAQGFRFAAGVAKLQSISFGLDAANPQMNMKVRLAAANALSFHLGIDQATATVLPHSQSVDISCTVKDVPKTFDLTGTNFRDQWSYTASDPIGSIGCGLHIGTLTCVLTVLNFPASLQLDYAEASHLNLTVSSPIGLFQLLCDDTVNGVPGTTAFFGANLKHAKIRLEQVPTLDAQWGNHVTSDEGKTGTGFLVDSNHVPIGLIEVDGAMVDVSPPAVAASDNSHWIMLVDQGTSGPEKRFGFHLVGLDEIGVLLENTTTVSIGNTGEVSLEFDSGQARPAHLIWNTDITSAIIGGNLGVNGELDFNNAPPSLYWSCTLGTQFSYHAGGNIDLFHVFADVSQRLNSAVQVTHVDVTGKGMPSKVNWNVDPHTDVGSIHVDTGDTGLGITEIKGEVTGGQGIFGQAFKYLAVDVNRIPASWTAKWDTHGVACDNLPPNAPTNPPPICGSFAASAPLGAVALILSRDVKANTPSHYVPFNQPGATVQYTPFASTIDQRYFDQGQGSTAQRDATFIGRLNALYSGSTQLNAGQDHFILRQDGSGQIGFLSAQITGIKNISAVIDLGNRRGTAHLEIPFPGATHPFYLGFEDTPGDFLTVNVPNIPTVMDADVDLSGIGGGHANVDFSSSLGTVTVYKGPLPQAHDGQGAFKVVVKNAPASVHASWAIGFPGMVNLTSSSAVEVAILAQDGGSRNIADLRVGNISANWGFNVGQQRGDCLDIIICGEFFVIADAFANLNVSPAADGSGGSLEGFFTNYDFISNPNGLDGGGPPPNSHEYVPRVSVIMANFTHFDVDAGIAVCEIGLCIPGTLVPFVDINTDLLGAFNLDFWDLGGGFLNVLGDPDYQGNDPWHLWPLFHDPNDHLLPFQ